MAVVKMHFLRICFYQYRNSDESTCRFLARKMFVSASPFKNGGEGEKSGEGSPRGRAVSCALVVWAALAGTEERL